MATRLKGEYYKHGCHCCDCGVELTDENVSERTIDSGLPAEPWESEILLEEQIERAAIIELICKNCYV